METKTTENKTKKIELADIDKDIQGNYKQFENFMKKYNKRKYESARNNALQRLKPVIDVVQQTYGAADVQTLRNAKSILKQSILEFDKIVYGDAFHTVSISEAEILSEALCAIRNINRLLEDEILKKGTANQTDSSL